MKNHSAQYQAYNIIVFRSLSLILTRFLSGKYNFLSALGTAPTAKGTDQHILVILGVIRREDYRTRFT